MAGRGPGSLVLASPVIDQYEALQLMEQRQAGRENVFKARRRKDGRLVVLKEILDPIGNRMEPAMEIHHTPQPIQHALFVQVLAMFEYEGGSVRVLEYITRAYTGTIADVLQQIARDAPGSP